MRIQSTLLVGLIVSSLLAGCSASSQQSTEASTRTPAQPAALQQIDRVSLLAWKETLGPKYPLTISRADSIAMIVALFNENASAWSEQASLSQTPMFAAFYHGAELKSQRGFLEFSHGAGGLLLIQEGGKLYSRPASPADIDRFLAFFGVGVVLYPN